MNTKLYRTALAGAIALPLGAASHSAWAATAIDSGADTTQVTPRTVSAAVAVPSRIIGQFTVDGIGGPLEVRAYSWGVTLDSGGAGGAGKSRFQPFTVVTPLSPSLGGFFNDVTTGRREKSATIVIFKPGTTAPLITYTLADVVVTAVRDSETGVRGDIPLEEIQFTYQSFDESFSAL